jgi:cyclopropane fatty-acyl-phospholipid synthase-like methyltransferase
VEDEAERFSYQLYHLVASGFKTLNNLAGLHVLEVGSGRGGGLCYVFRYLKPASAFGVDYSPA